jgi:hypothetical protein
LNNEVAFYILYKKVKGAFNKINERILVQCKSYWDNKYFFN